MTFVILNRFEILGVTKLLDENARRGGACTASELLRQDSAFISGRLPSWRME